MAVVVTHLSAMAFTRLPLQMMRYLPVTHQEQSLALMAQ
jgi:hypothetical protein